MSVQLSTRYKRLSYRELEKILYSCTRPARYIGGELNSAHKDLGATDFTLAMAFPDVYEIGMSNLGIQMLYEIVNDLDFAACERVFLPAVDMGRILRERKISLFTLENRAPVKDFDILGISIPHEMLYTNVLELLDLCCIPLLRRDRARINDHLPIVLAGGMSTINPEPISDFIDLFALGDGEELIVEIAQQVRKLKKEGATRKKIVESISDIEGIYNPDLIDFGYKEPYTVDHVVLKSSKRTFRKRIVSDLNEYQLLKKPIVPVAEPVHSRFNIEIMRGCLRGCRFCQAGFAYRPLRERSIDNILQVALGARERYGYDEVSLSSLSSTDFTSIKELIGKMFNAFDDSPVSISLPSLRLDSFSVNLAGELARNRKTNLTFAPEAGSHRLRKLINKDISDEQILENIGAAFRLGWTKIKLYFMIGLPQETDDDVLGIVKICEEITELAGELLPQSLFRSRFKLILNLALFSPKPHTPFQWVGQRPPQYFMDKKDEICTRLSKRIYDVRWHDPYSTSVESALGRGNRNVGKAILNAWNAGAKFDSWSEYFNAGRWFSAFKEEGLDLDRFAEREIPIDGILPWDHIDMGINKDFLKNELMKSEKGELTQDCRKSGCVFCDICHSFGVRNVLNE